MSDTWDGNERRVPEQRLAEAMADVRGLRGAVVQLTEALTIKSETLHKVMVRMAILFAALFIAQMISSAYWVSQLNGRIDRGHTEILCTLNLTPEQKTALGDLACK